MPCSPNDVFSGEPGPKLQHTQLRASAASYRTAVRWDGGFSAPPDSALFLFAGTVMANLSNLLLSQQEPAVAVPDLHTTPGES